MDINTEFDFNQDVIDSRDFYERYEELLSKYDEFETPEEIKNWSDLQEYTELKELVEYLGETDCSFGVVLIAESYFTEYVKELLEDCGDVPREMPWYIAIDWEETARNVAVDYSEVEVNGQTFLFRI